MSTVRYMDLMGLEEYGAFLAENNETSGVTCAADDSVMIRGVR